MEKKLKLIATLLQKRFSVSSIEYEIFNYSTKESKIRFKAYNGKDFINASNYQDFITRLIKADWINPEDLIPKKREKREVIINKGKL